MYSRTIGLKLAIGVFFLLVAVKSSEAGPVVSTWPQPGGLGTPITLTYSYSNLLDGSIAGLTPTELVAATEEALGLWASAAPITFMEVADSGPAVSDSSYSASIHPLLRIGGHSIPGSVIGHAYFPATTGLAGDVHMDTDVDWSAPGFFLEIMVHELGHALGLGHSETVTMPVGGGTPFAPIMCATCLHDFSGGGFLYEDDVAGIQDAYGAGVGEVIPLASTAVPEPSSLALLGMGAVCLITYRRRNRNLAA